MTAKFFGMEQARVDFLTKFFQREYLDSFLDNLLLESKLNKREFCLAVVDLDHFKRINDRFGHVFGDEILKYFCSTLRLTLANTKHTVFRYGGDEFVVVFQEKNLKESYRLLRMFSYNLSRRPFLLHNRFHRVTSSSGIANFPRDSAIREELVKKADAAAYFSKKNGRNLVTAAYKIKYLNLRNKLLMACCIMAILWSSHRLYKSLNGFIEPAFKKIKTLRVTMKPEYLDVLVLKNGAYLEGKILAESEDKIIFSVFLKSGEGNSVFHRSEIAQIKRRAKAIAR
ncbi:MAG: GGDEF domain-containing protein [Candidatus Omnitrophota bacterium]|nr:GGDEF domain-containing protein [Candidatus Omnitrophota bacterium]